MIRTIEQMPLAERIPTLADMVRSARSQKDAYAQQEAEYLDMLAQAEATIGNQDIEPSGLIEQNPYAATGEDAPPASENTDAPADNDS